MRYLSLILLIAAFACTEDDDPKDKFTVETLTPVVKGDSIYLQGRLSTFDVSEFGFQIGIDEDASSGGITWENVMPDKINGSYFISRLSYDEYVEHSYVVRAFALRSGTYYTGEDQAFQGKGLSAEIDSFEPAEGGAQTIVRITGANFGNSTRIFFGELEAEIMERSANVIIVEVPNYLYAGDVIISATNGGAVSHASTMFRLYGPAIENYAAERIANDLVITINGAGFSDLSWRNDVWITNQSGRKVYKLDNLNVSANEIIASTNARHLFPGSYEVTVWTNDIASNAKEVFEFESKWEEEPNMPGDGFQGFSSFVIEKTLYLCGGTNVIGTGTNQLWSFDTETRTWHRHADFPGGVRSHGVSFAIGAKGYFGAGSSDSQNSYDDFWEYDPVNDHWTKLTNLPGGVRNGGIGFSSGGYGYMGLGQDGITFKKDLWKYDPESDSWIELPEFQGHGRAAPHIAVLNNSLYVIGGTNAFEDGPTDDTWKFDLAQSEWQLIGSVDNTISAVAYSGTNCYALVTETDVSLQRWLSVHRFNPENNSFEEYDLFPGHHRSRPGLVIVDDELFAGLGIVSEVSGNSSDFWSYRLQE